MPLSGRYPSRAALALIAVVAWAGIGLFFLFSSLSAWPPITGDSITLSPPAVTYAANKSLVNKIWPGAMQYDPRREGRLVYHGFFYQMVLGSIMSQPSYKSLFLAIQIINIATLGCIAYIFLRALQTRSHLNIFLKTLILLSALLGSAAALFFQAGRPEPFATLILTLACCGIVVTDKRLHWLAAALAIGCLACTHIVATILSTTIFLIYISARFSYRKAARYIFLMFALAAVTANLILSWYPYSFLDWVKGNLYHAPIYVKHGWGAKLLCDYWLLSPNTFLLSGIYVCGAISALYLYKRLHLKIKSRWLFLICISILLFLSFHWGISDAPHRYYNFLPFIPLAYAVSIYMISVLSNNTAKRALLSRGGVAVMIIVFMLSTAGFLRGIVLFNNYLREGMRYDKAREIFLSIRCSDSKGKILITPGLFSLTEDYRNVIARRPPLWVRNKRVEYVVFQQVNFASTEPPTIKGFELVDNFFNPRPPTFFGIKIANTVKGYNFAIYRRAAPGGEGKIR